MIQDSKSRFSNRVADYVRYRPKYPAEVVRILADEGVTNRDSVVADLGSGTGFLAELFLEYGCTVHGVEPNEAMRQAGVDYLSQFDRFHSINGTAEATGLANSSVDLVTAGQAMHWFDMQKTRDEILRIGRGECWFAVAHNDRDIDASDFMREYDELLHRVTAEYQEVRCKYHPMLEYIESIDDYRVITLPNEQRFDEEGLVGRVMSSSYAPVKGQPGHKELIDGLKSLFRQHNTDGVLAFQYKTVLEFAPLA